MFQVTNAETGWGQYNSRTIVEKGDQIVDVINTSSLRSIFDLCTSPTTTIEANATPTSNHPQTDSRPPHPGRRLVFDVPHTTLQGARCELGGNDERWEGWDD